MPERGNGLFPTTIDFLGTTIEASHRGSDGDDGEIYTVNLSSARGTLTVDPDDAETAGVTIDSGYGTLDLRLQGTVDQLNELLNLGSGFRFTPALYFSGEAFVTIRVTDGDVVVGLVDRTAVMSALVEEH